MLKKKSILKTQTLVRRKRRMFWFRVGLYSVFSLTIVSGIIYLFHIPKFSILNVSIEGAVSAPEADIKAKVTDDISGNYFFVFPKRNILLYPKSKIHTDILKQFPRVETVDLSLHSWNSLQAEVTERKPYAVWCKDEPLMPENANSDQGEIVTGNCFFMDVTGFIFDQAPTFSGDTYIRYYGNLTGEPVGQTFNPSLSLADTKKLLSALKDRDIGITDVVVKDFDYELYTRKHQKLYIDPMQGVEKTLENLSIILTEAKNATSTWQYIDLRYGNKVYLKRG
jgi:hypothetical protein